jgi:hypothetical protein
MFLLKHNNIKLFIRYLLANNYYLTVRVLAFSLLFPTKIAPIQDYENDKPFLSSPQAPGRHPGK